MQGPLLAHLPPIYNRIGMGRSCGSMRGLTKAENVEVSRDGIRSTGARYWRAAFVNGTEFAYPRRVAGLEQDAISEFAYCSEFVASTQKAYRAWRDRLAQLAGYERG